MISSHPTDSSCSDQKNPYVHFYYRSITAYDDGCYEEALDFIRQSTLQYGWPEPTPAMYIIRARCLFFLERLDEARVAYEFALRAFLQLQTSRWVSFDKKINECERRIRVCYDRLKH